MASSSTNHADSDANIFPIAASPKKQLTQSFMKDQKTNDAYIDIPEFLDPYFVPKEMQDFQ